MLWPLSWKRLGDAIVVSVLVAGTAWLGQLVYHSRVVHAVSADPAVGTAPVVLPVNDALGEPEELILEGRERPLLLMVMKTTCPFCEENMPHWSELLGELAAAETAGMDAVVLSLSPPGETEAYLRRHAVDIPVAYADQATLRLLGLRGVPATVVVEPQRRSLSVWSGVLTRPERRAVLAWGVAVSSSDSTNGTSSRDVGGP